MKTSVQRARATNQESAGKPSAMENSATQKTNSPSNPKIAAAKTAVPKAALPKKALSKLNSSTIEKSGAAAAKQSTPAAAPVKLSVKKTVVVAAQKMAPEKTVASNLFNSDKPAALRATKKRAPKDLATQYGESVKTPRATVVESKPRKRRNAQSRAKLQAVIAPDDGLMQRLARAGAISSSQTAEGSADFSSKPLSTRRSRKWETLCGKCGVSAQYSSSAALCVKCGAILVRE